MKIDKKGLLFGILLMTSHANIFASTAPEAEKVLETQNVQTSEEDKSVVAEKINASTVNTANQPGQATDASEAADSTKRKIKISRTISWTIFIPFVIEPLLWYQGLFQFNFWNACIGLLCITLPFLISLTWQPVLDSSLYRWMAKGLGMSKEGDKENNTLECFLGLVTLFCLGAAAGAAMWRNTIGRNVRSNPYAHRWPSFPETVTWGLAGGSLLSFLGVTIFFLPEILIARPLELLIEYYQSRGSEKGSKKKNTVSKKKSAKKS